MAIYTLTGETKEINVLGRYASVKNNGEETIYASSSSDLSPEAPDVVPIQAGESVIVRDCRKKLYVSGSGLIAVVSGNDPVNFFKPAPKGGSGGGGSGEGVTQQQLNDTLKFYATNTSVDTKLEGYAEKDEIPASLPANGGNADTVGGYTSDQLIQGNPNLLDNPDFRINQRGQESYSAVGYTVDRWRLEGGSLKVTPQDLYLHIESTGGGGNVPFTQPIEPMTFSQPQAVTLSILARGSFVYQTAIMCSDGEHSTGWKSLESSDWQLISVTYIVPEGVSVDSVRAIQARSTNTAGRYIDIKMAKLELGSKQTLAHQDSSGNWVLNDPPPNPILELQKCQYYYEKGKAYVSGLGIAAEKYSDWTSGYEIAPKRVLPTVTISNLKNNTAPLPNPCLIFVALNANKKYTISLRETNKESVFTANTAFMINFDYEASADL